MNPSFEAFVDPSDGFHDKLGTPSNREGQFPPPEAWIVGEPRMQPFFEAFVNPADEVHRFPEPLRTAKDKLHSPRPRIAGETINGLCRSMLLKLGNSLSEIRCRYYI